MPGQAIYISYSVGRSDKLEQYHAIILRNHYNYFYLLYYKQTSRQSTLSTVQYSTINTTIQPPHPHHHPIPFSFISLIQCLDVDRYFAPVVPACPPPPDGFGACSRVVLLPAARLGGVGRRCCRAEASSCWLPRAVVEVSM